METIKMGLAKIANVVSIGGIIVADKEQQKDAILNNVRAAILGKYGFTRFRGVNLADLRNEISIDDSVLRPKLGSPLPTETLEGYVKRITPDVNLYLQKTERMLSLPNFIQTGTDALWAIEMPKAPAIEKVEEAPKK